MDELNIVRLKRIVAAVAACCGGAFAPAHAQESSGAPQADEEIVVTGSFLTRPADRPQPVQVLGREALALEQRVSVGEVLKDMPITQGMAVLNNVGESGDAPTTSINLRGLGSRATLPLLNGRRQVIDANGGIGDTGSVDINNLAPAIMIERVEILTDGASALYGSDAIAGVVNFITRRDFEGIELSLQGQSVDRASTSDYTLGALFGSQSDASSLVAAIEITRRDGLDVEDLYDFDRLSSAGTSAFGNPSSLQPGGISTRFPDPLCGDPRLGGPPHAGLVNGNQCQLLLSLGRTMAAPVERTLGFATATYDLADNLGAALEIGFARARQERNSGFGFPLTGVLPVVPASNPGVQAALAADPDFCAPHYGPDGTCAQDYGIWHRLGSPIASPETRSSEQDNWRVAGSLDGELGVWTWNASLAMSENDTLAQDPDARRENLNLALNCMGGPSGDRCYNPLANSFLASPGDPEWNDPLVVDWIAATRVGIGHAELRTLDLLFTRELGALAGGPTGLALGFQHREDEFSYDWDTLSNSGGLVFNPEPVLDFGGARDSSSLFAELVMFPSETLEIQLAARKEDYGRGVDSFDPKVGLLWTPTERLFFRASAGTSFKIPGEVQTWGQSSNALITDFRDGQQVETRGLRRGNSNLEPEEGESFTAGVTWDATDRFTMELNYFNIKFTNLVRAEDAEALFQLDIADGTIDDPRFEISPAAGTNVVALLDATDITGFNLSYINQDFQETDGVDFRFDWNAMVGANDLTVSLQGTKTLTYDLSESGVLVDAVGSYNTTNFAPPIPEWQGALRLDWQRGAHFARMTARHTPALEEDNEALQGLTEEFDYTSVDLLYRYSRPEGLSLSFAVLNVADQEDPRSAGTGNLTTAFSQIYDPRGRIFTFGLNKAF